VPYILTIQERNHSWAGRGPVRSEHATKEEAQATLIEYVSRNWDAEIGTEAPEDPNELVDAYFADALETYSIQKTA